MMLVGGVLLAAALQPMSAGAQPLVTGVADVQSDPVLLQHVRDSGSQFVHIWISMSSISPQTEPDHWQPEDPADRHYNWDSADLSVANAVQAGLTPVLGIYGVPIWAQRCSAPGGIYGAPCDPDPRMIATFAAAAARRYSGYFDGSAEGAVLAGAERAQPEPLLQSAIRKREAGLGEAL